MKTQRFDDIDIESQATRIMPSKVCAIPGSRVEEPVEQPGAYIKLNYYPAMGPMRLCVLASQTHIITVKCFYRMRSQAPSAGHSVVLPSRVLVPDQDIGTLSRRTSNSTRLEGVSRSGLALRDLLCFEEMSTEPGY